MWLVHRGERSCPIQDSSILSSLRCETAPTIYTSRSGPYCFFTSIVAIGIVFLLRVT